MSTDLPEKPLSPWWRHAVILVMAFGFSVLTMVTVLTYTNAPPIPERVTDAAGATLFTRENVEHGQEVRLSEIARDTLALERHGRPYAELDPEAAGGVDGSVHRLLKENRRDPSTGTLLFTPAEAKAWETQKAEWADYFSGAETAA